MEKTISCSAWALALSCIALLLSACYPLPMCGVLQDHYITCHGDVSIPCIFISHINVLFLLQKLILNTSG